MKILVLGASGLIGSAICMKLASEGHAVVAGARSLDDPLPHGITRAITFDMAEMLTPERWEPLLCNIDIVINCTGILQDGPRDDTQGVHANGPAALFDACVQAGIQKIIHFSAMGVNRQQPSRFSSTKLEAEEILMASPLNWVILRPSVVVGRGVFGASALFRGLAALPWVPLMPATGKLQIVQLDDIVATVSYFARLETERRLAIDVAGPEQLTFADVVAAYRQWLGWRPARSFRLPQFVARLIYLLGDWAGWLGWRPPVRTTAAREIARGAVGDPTAWISVTGIHPASLGSMLLSSPATVQERWFAKLYFLKALIFAVLPIFWISTGIVSLTVGYEIGMDLMRRGGAGSLSSPAVIGGAFADIAVGVCMAIRPLARWGLIGAIVLCLFYAIAGTVILPELWKEPLGPLLKIWPIFVTHLVALAILRER